MRGTCRECGRPSPHHYQSCSQDTRPRPTPPDRAAQAQLRQASTDAAKTVRDALGTMFMGVSECTGKSFTITGPIAGHSFDFTITVQADDPR